MGQRSRAGRPFQKLLYCRKEVMVAWTSDGASEKQADPGYYLKIKPTRFAETFIV